MHSFARAAGALLVVGTAVHGSPWQVKQHEQPAGLPQGLPSFLSSALSQWDQYTQLPSPMPTWSHHNPPHGPHPTQTTPSRSTSTPYYSANATTSTASPYPTGTSSAACKYWLEDVKHQGIAAFNPDPASYQVFRNVKDFGAKGDGVTDDAAAINLAISSGDRCAPGVCNSTTTTPALVYFPPGVYAISTSIIDYYYTQLVGNPNCLPTIRALPDFNTTNGSIGLIDGDIYGSNGDLTTGATNEFWRQIRNFVLDMTAIPAEKSVTGIHWPTGQATSIQNVVFDMSSEPGTQHIGIGIEQGSGGFVNDLVFNGGLYGGSFGNQQFTMRNLTFNNVRIAINQIWDWGWTYQNININNSTIGLNMSSGGPTAQAVGSVTLFDSKISNTAIGILTAHDLASQPPASGSLILENVDFEDVDVPVQGPNGNVALAETSHVDAWGQGHAYTPSGPTNFEGAIAPNVRPSSLVTAEGKYYERSKPQYGDVPLSQFVSARDQGVTGDGHTDDTKALQKAIETATSSGKILLLDHGDYLVSSTIRIPAGAKIVGESYSVILATGAHFIDMSQPQPVLQIGHPGETGTVEVSDLIVSTQGSTQGAVLFEYNLASPTAEPSGLWDVHARVGGFAGSNLQLAQCPTTPDVNVTASNLATQCIADFLTFHITSSGSGLYLENVWLWVADHDVEDPLVTQITIYAGRGLLDESQTGAIWMVGTSVEHHTKYQYQFANTRNVFMGQIQTETAYYQPNPSAPLPFPYVASLSDPQFPNATFTTSNGTVIPAADGWGLRIVSSESIFAYGAGLYSFFDNYSTNCSAIGNFEVCQSSISSIEGSRDISLYNLNTVGAHYSLTLDGKDVVYFEDNIDNFVDTVALFRTS